MAAHAPWTQHEPDTGDDDRWHVMIAPGEVKILTLDQLDDLFRLEIIDENTSVRQSHMTGWLPLGVVAGLEAEPAKPAAPPAPRGGQPSAPPAGRSAPPAPRLVATVPPSQAQVAAAFAAPAPSTPSRRPPVAAHAAGGAAGQWPSASRSTAEQAALFAPVPSVQLASETLRPMASESELVFRSRGSGSGGWLIALAVLLGAGVTLYRNGVVRDVARSSGREAIYGRLEAAVGGPSFGTLRAVEQLDVVAVPARASAAPSVVSYEGSPARAEEPVPVQVEASRAKETTPSHPVRLEDLAPEKAGPASAAGSKPVSLEALPQPDLATPHPVARTAVAVKRTPLAVAPSHVAAASRAPAPVKRRAKDASRMYDPLNPDL